MKKTLFFSIASFIIAMGFTACGDDDKDSETSQYESSQFVGEWCTVDESGYAATEISISQNFSFQGTVYQDLSGKPKVFDQISGTWMFYASNETLVMNMFHSYNTNSSTTSYKVQKLEDGVMQLRNQDLGAVETYYKLVDRYTANVNEEFDVSYTKAGTVSSYVSTNSNVAKVDSRGHVTAVSGGVAFIRLTTEQGNVWVKVTIGSRVAQYVALTLSTVDAVKATYGQPDLEQYYSQNMAMVYQNPTFDSALAAIQFQYDETTREVTRIQTRYKDLSVFEEDEAEIKHQYVHYDNTTMYGTASAFMEADVVMSPFTDSTGSYVSYQNMPYYKKNNHY